MTARASGKLKITLVAASVAIFLIWAVPAFMRARHMAAANYCINNLCQIDGATQEWALEHHKAACDIPVWTDLVPRYLNGRPSCAEGGTYTLGRIGENPKCSVPGHALP